MCGSLSMFALGVVLCAAAPRQSVRETQRHIDVIERRVANATGRGSRADAAAVERLFAERKASLEALLSRQFDPDGAISVESLTPAALVCERLMDYERAIDFATRALERDPTEPEAVFPLVRALLNTGRIADARVSLDRSACILGSLSRVRGLYGVVARFQGRRGQHRDAADSLNTYLEYRFRLLAAGDERIVSLHGRLVALRTHCAQAEGALNSFARLTSGYRLILKDALGNEQAREGGDFSLSQRTAICVAELELEASAGNGLDDAVCRALDLFLAPGNAHNEEWCAGANRYLAQAAKLLADKSASAEVDARLRRLLAYCKCEAAPDASLGSSQRRTLENRLRKMLKTPIQ